MGESTLVYLLSLGGDGEILTIIVYLDHLEVEEMFLVDFLSLHNRLHVVETVSE